MQLVSDDEDDVPLKARPVAKAWGGDESSDDDDGVPLKARPVAKAWGGDESSDDDDDVPLKARPVAKAWGGDESSDDDDGGAMPQCVEHSDDATPLKVKVVNRPCLCDSRNNPQPKVELWQHGHGSVISLSSGGVM